MDKAIDYLLGIWECLRITVCLFVCFLPYPVALSLQFVYVFCHYVSFMHVANFANVRGPQFVCFLPLPRPTVFTENVFMCTVMFVFFLTLSHSLHKLFKCTVITYLSCTMQILRMSEDHSLFVFFLYPGPLSLQKMFLCVLSYLSCAMTIYYSE
jgi:hypothetical protein